VEACDEELLEALREATPGAEDKQLRKALDQLEKDGRLAVLREDVAMRKAVDLVADHAKPIEPSLAEARGKIWTPGDPD
jgi:hypothetical protein